MVVPWLRTIRIYLSLKGKPRVDLLATTRVRIRIWPNDLDTYLHVNNGRYLTLADLGRLDWFIRTGVYEKGKQLGVMPVVGDSIAKFRRELKAFQSVDIETQLVGWSGRWGYLEHRFVREGRVVALVGIRGTFTGPKGTIESWDFLGQSKTGMASSPPLPEWARAFNESADLVSVMLRAEERRG